MEDILAKNLAEKAYEFQTVKKAPEPSRPENHGQSTHNNQFRRKIPQPPTVFDWRYGEGEIFADLETHMKSTYTSHYTSENLEKIQTIDVFAHRGTLGSTSIDNAIKYLMRYGKKSGKNEKDLIKALHYLVLATAFERKMKTKETVDIIA